MGVSDRQELRVTSTASSKPNKGIPRRTRRRHVLKNDVVLRQDCCVNVRGPNWKRSTSMQGSVVGDGGQREEELPNGDN